MFNTRLIKLILVLNLHLYVYKCVFFLLLQFKKKIRGEQQRRKEVEEDIKALKQELENKINQVCAHF